MEVMVAVNSFCDSSGAEGDGSSAVVPVLVEGGTEVGIGSDGGAVAASEMSSTGCACACEVVEIGRSARRGYDMGRASLRVVRARRDALDRELMLRCPQARHIDDTADRELMLYAESTTNKSEVFHGGRLCHLVLVKLSIANNTG